MAWDDGLEGPARQFAAADADAVRALAGPGTGKTFSLLRRVARMIETGAEPRGVFVGRAVCVPSPNAVPVPMLSLATASFMPLCVLGLSPGDTGDTGDSGECPARMVVRIHARQSGDSKMATAASRFPQKATTSLPETGYCGMEATMASGVLTDFRKGSHAWSETA